MSLSGLPSETPERPSDMSEAEHRRTVRLLIDFYGAVSVFHADPASPESLPSLDTCELSTDAGAVPDFSEPALSRGLTDYEADALDAAFRLGIEDVDRAARLVVGGGERIEALWAALERGEDRQQKVIELLERDEVGKAKRLAYCERRSVQLECPDDFAAGGCGSDDNYVPISCGLRICPDCATAQKMEKLERYKPVVRDMENPTFGTFTIENVEDIERGFDFIIDSFGKLRNRTVPPSGETVRYKDGEEIVKRWCWSNDGGQPAEQWKSQLLGNGRHDLARRLQRHYVNAEWEDVTGKRRGKNIPMKELIKGGIYAIDIKAVRCEDGEYNLHLHAVTDMAYIPQAALSAVWEDITGAPVVDVRRIYDRSEDGIEDALMETVGYALKEPEFETVEEEVDYQLAMEDRRLVNPFGDLHGNVPDRVTYLVCAECEKIPLYWNYCGLIDGEHDNMGSCHGADGDRPPPGADPEKQPMLVFGDE